MKHYFKKYERMLSFHHYISVLRRQPVHVQRVSALIFAGSITALLAAIILYVDYGFWHERYSRSDDALTAVDTTSGESGGAQITVVSPGEMLGGFFREASTKMHDLNLSQSSFLKGNDTYRKEEEK